MVASEGFTNVHDHGTVVDKKKVKEFNANIVVKW